jgi:Rrf2 family nitric oxide-sensitive transcriptional repressor
MLSRSSSKPVFEIQVSSFRISDLIEIKRGAFFRVLCLGMRLTRYTDYALRMLVYLGLHRERLCPITEIANAYAISQNHLTKVAQDLRKAGFVSSERGRHGGLRLARPPAAISVGGVVRAMEGETCLADCGACLLAPRCSLISALSDAHDAFLASLDKVSLETIVSGSTMAPTLPRNKAV